MRLSGISRAGGYVRQCTRALSSSNNLPKSLGEMRESFANGSTSNYIDSMYESYAKDPSSVHASWQSYFKALDDGLPVDKRFQVPPTLSQVGADSAPAMSQVSTPSDGGDAYKLSLLIRAYQVRGHLQANLDPLGLEAAKDVPELSLSTYGWSEADLDKVISLGNHTHISGFLAKSGTVRLGEIIDRLRHTYCKTIGAEYMHLQDREECNWVRDRMEQPVPYSFPDQYRKVILDRLTWADSFERFLAHKWATAKRFGMDGGETMIPGLKALIDRSSDLGVNNIVLGMPHRGRLAVLANVLRKPMAQVFSEFSGGGRPEDAQGSGDVKYHLGTTCIRPTRGGGMINLALLANPSHLEAVNPVVLGKTRAKQHFLNDKNGDQVMGVLLHGDAAFAGQGVIAETFNMWELEGYKTGGTIHVVVNNQIGFTTDPVDSRSSPYCTSIAKAADAPIFHVNGDDAEAVVHVFEMAAEFRQKWKKDVVVDLICYRRYGHNEMDQPAFTQPLMYNKISKMKSSLKQYQEKLIAEGVITEEEAKQYHQNVEEHLEEAYKAAPDYVPKSSDWLASHWQGFKSKTERARIKVTGVETETLKDLGKKLCEIPEGFTAHKALARQLKQRRQMFESKNGKPLAPLNWAAAELLAYATLLTEGNHVRLSGQDVQRGTFSHRHAIITDQKTGEDYNLLSNLSSDQAEASIFNSPLSEYGILGFELGYALEHPRQLVIWEAQFGDFANSGQVIIDQFLASGESKWMRQCGLTVMLPHGMEGMGPEHSSARIERYLELVESDPFTMPTDDSPLAIQNGNLQVVQPTTPANLFHVLRRQVHREFRKPLIIFTPKSLLRHKRCVSELDQLDDQADTFLGQTTDDLRFVTVLPEMDPAVVNNAKNVGRLLFCSGKVYYDLVDERERRGLNDVAIVRLEQLAPFPFAKVKEAQDQFPNATSAWVQEEHMNAGAYTWAYLHFRTALNGAHVPYVGRGPSAAPATGVGSVHEQEHKMLLHDAFDRSLKD